MDRQDQRVDDLTCRTHNVLFIYIYAKMQKRIKVFLNNVYLIYATTKTFISKNHCQFIKHIDSDMTHGQWFVITILIYEWFVCSYKLFKVKGTAIFKLKRFCILLTFRFQWVWPANRLIAWKLFNHLVTKHWNGSCSAAVHSWNICKFQQ